MENYVFPTLQFNFHRLHEPLTGRGTIARIYINMLTPETLRAVIRVAVPHYLKPTLLAGKVLLRPLEFFSCHPSILPLRETSEAPP